MASMFEQAEKLLKIQKSLEEMKGAFLFNKLDAYGRKGVEALSAATPKKTGKTASSWTYKLTRNGSSFSLQWNNGNVHNGVNIAVILQYGHALRGGAYVQGRDYINPAIRPIINQLLEDIRKEIGRL